VIAVREKCDEKRRPVLTGKGTALIKSKDGLNGQLPVIGVIGRRSSLLLELGLCGQRLPELNLISIRVIDPGKAAVGFIHSFGVNLYSLLF
jgi:hypothetical protein